MQEGHVAAAQPAHLHRTLILKTSVGAPAEGSITTRLTVWSLSALAAAEAACEGKQRESRTCKATVRSIEAGWPLTAAEVNVSTASPPAPAPDHKQTQQSLSKDLGTIQACLIWTWKRRLRAWSARTAPRAAGCVCRTQRHTQDDARLSALARHRCHSLDWDA